MPEISRRESSALISSLTAGVVPRIGLRHIAVGRQKEIEALLLDLQTVAEAGSSFRIICGQYGSGKSFLLQLIRINALERNFVVADADLSPERRFTGTHGQGLATYRELLRQLSIETRPEGGAIESIMQKWIVSLQASVAKENQLAPGDASIVQLVSEKIGEMLKELSEMTFGFSFAAVLDAYWRGLKSGDDNLKQSAIRWLRGEYSTKTDARKALSVDTIIDDQNWYEFLKLFARFVTLAGYQGLLIFLDEGVNLYKIPNKQARESNYEKLLTIFNDTMQGKAQHIGFFFNGTPQFVFDEKRGLFSYEALRSRLAGNQFSSMGYVDYTSPVLTLNQLTLEEIYILLERLCVLHGAHYQYECAFTQEQLTAFLEKETRRLGADKLLTPREVIRDFLMLLNVLHQQEDATFESLLGLPPKESGDDPGSDGDEPAADGGEDSPTPSRESASDESSFSDLFEEFDI